MKFDRKILQQKAQAYLTNAEKRADLKLADALSSYEGQDKEWIRKYGEVAKAEARTVLRLIRAGKAPTTMDVNVLRQQLPWRADKPARIFENPQRYAQAQALVEILKATKDEEVSSSALQTLGIRDIAWLIR